MLNVCQKCTSKEIRVVDSRRTSNYTRRRLKCFDCGHRFTTHEIREEDHIALKQKKVIEDLDVQLRAFVKRYVHSLSPEAQSRFFEELMDR